MKNCMIAAVALIIGAMAAVSCQKEEQPSAGPEVPDTTPVVVPDRKEAVDLGLSVLWASCNLGAHSPEGFGRYFAWGETIDKSYYDWQTYRYCDSAYNKLTKYCAKISFGIEDDLQTLEPADDAAAVRWGDGWRMPTPEESKELLDSCEWTWTALNDINGYEVKGPSGNSIFIPAAGYRHKDSVFYANLYALYWLDALYESYPTNARCYSFNRRLRGNTYYSRNDGLTVRAVRAKEE